MISYAQFRKYAMWPVVSNFPTPNLAIQCLSAFVAHESDGGKYLHQVGGGPALGPYQMEPATKRLVDRWVRRDDGTPMWGKEVYFQAPVDELMTDMKCATWYARVLLLADPYPLPKLNDEDGVWATYRRVWGPGKPPTKAHFLEKAAAWRRT